MTKGIETRIFVVRDGKRQSVESLPRRKPFVGIWWHDARTLVAIGEPAAKTHPPGRLVDSNLEHVREWPRIAAEFGKNAESEYFEIPRGRVLWESECEQGIVYHGNGTTAEILNALGRIFHLQRWQHRLDEHYLMGEAVHDLFEDDQPG